MFRPGVSRVAETAYWTNPSGGPTYRLEALGTPDCRFHAIAYLVDCFQVEIPQLSEEDQGKSPQKCHPDLLELQAGTIDTEASYPTPDQAIAAAIDHLAKRLSSGPGNHSR